MLSLCFQITKPATIIERGKKLHAPDIKSKIGIMLTKANDPSDTKPLRQIITRQTNTPSKSGQNAIGIYIPTLVATALPPLKYIKHENTCPSTAASAVSVIKTLLSLHDTAIPTGKVPFNISQIRVIIPYFLPQRRATLVEPTFFDPAVRGSILQHFLLISSPKGIAPIK